MDTEKIKFLLKEVIQDLVNDDFPNLAYQDRLGPSTVEEYRRALTGYLKRNEKLTIPPEEAFHHLRIYETSSINRVRLDFDLWVNDDESDLTAQIYVEQEGDCYKIQIYDIRVL